MAAYRRVYESRHLRADCQEPGSAPEGATENARLELSAPNYRDGISSGTLCLVIEHGLPLPFLPGQLHLQTKIVLQKTLRSIGWRDGLSEELLASTLLQWILNKAGVKRELLDTVKAKKLAYCGQSMRKQGSCLEKEIRQGTMPGARRR